jgi:hypothetical protein
MYHCSALEKRDKRVPVRSLYPWFMVDLKEVRKDVFSGAKGKRRVSTRVQCLDFGGRECRLRAD